MKTLGRNADNDLYLEAGGLAILHDADAQCAVIEAILQTQQGELQFDPDRGIDYFGTVLQSPTYIDFWAAQVQSRIEDLDFVASVDDFTYRFDNQTSTLYWSMTVTNTDEDRLDLRDKKTVIDGSPGTDISWNDIYDKPIGVQQALDMVEAMHEEAVDTREKLTPSSTLRDTKGLLNRIIFDPNNEEYAKTRQVSFTFSGVPLGIVIDLSRLRVDIENTGTTANPYYAPFIVEISDGLKVRSDQTIAKWEEQTKAKEGKGNKVLFLDEEKNAIKDEDDETIYTTPRHTLMAGGSITLTIKGNIKKIWSAREVSDTEDVEDAELPIFIHTRKKDGRTIVEPFQYLTGFTVGERVPLASIGKGSFRGFGNLQKIVWNEANEESIILGDYAFAGCSSLMEITWLPVKTESIGVGCFQDCKSLVSLQGLDSTLIAQIPDDCFYGCTQLKTCGNLPSGLTSIGSHVFKGCTSFKNIDELPQTIESLGEECFCGCTGITAILYPPESLKTIGKRCFADCTSLESLYLSASTTKIGEETFANCAMLTNIMSDADDVPKLDATAFDGETPIVYVPASLLSDYQRDSVWGVMTVKKYGVYEFALENVQAGTTLLDTTSNLISDSVWTITYGIGDKQQRFIPSVDALPSFTYKEAVANATITIKGYVRRIAAASSESYPFLAATAASPFTNLKSVTVTNSPLEMIGDYAFAQCVNLASIECGLKEERDYCLGERAFWGCSALTSTDWLKAGLGRLVKEHTTTYEQLDDGTIVPIETNIPFPAFGERCFWQSGITSLEYAKTDVTALPAYCFAETNIKNIDNVGTEALTSLGEYCFYKCTTLNNIQGLRSTGVSTLPDYCFAECTSLNSIAGIENIGSANMGSYVFADSGITSIAPIEYASGITAIAPYMFAGCALSTLAGLTDKITELGEGCFSRNSLLKDIFAILKARSVTEIPAKCFQASGLLALIGCWNITSIGDYAFSDCTSLIATSGLGPDIASIGDYAFQNCTGLKQVSCVASNVPTISSSAFRGAPASGIPLYVKEDMVGNFSSAATWNNFGKIASRTIKVHLQNIGGTELGDVNIDADAVVKTGVKVSIDPSAEHYLGVWYADYGDGTEFDHFYSSDSSVHNALDKHTYDERGNYTITLFGDIIEVWGDHTDDIVNGDYVANPPEDMKVSPFLKDLSRKASSIAVSSEYLRKIGAFCFFDYGQSHGDGNDNALSVSVEMNGNGTVGAYAFAKKDDAHGPIGTLGAFNAVEVGDYAFYQGGLNSSTPFSTVKTAGKAAFAKNPLLTELSGFTSLTKVTVSLFEGCTGLITTSGLSAVTEIQDHGFKDCTGLTSVKDFSASFAKIGAGAFYNCPNITRIFMANVNPPYLAQDGFDSVGNEFLPNALVYVPAGRESAYQEQEYWYKFQTESDGIVKWRITSRAITFVLQNVTKDLKIPAKSFIVSATGNWTLDFGEGEVKRQYTAGTKEIDTYTFNSTSALKEVKISGPVTSIQCTSSAYPIFGKEVGGKLLTSVSISEAMDITEIGDYLFRECSALQSITDASTIVSVGEYSFADATELTDITGLSNISSIERYAFSGCASLTNLYGFNHVTTIGERAFNGCSSLKKIDGLGTGVTSIGAYAFASCPLQEVQMFAEEPPTMPTTAFSGLSSEVPLYVRTKCLTAYKESSSWGSVFGDIRSRFVEFTLTACPSNLTVKGNVGKVKSDTFWVVDWDAYDSDGVPSKDGAEEQYLPQHTYSLSGNHTMRIEGAVTFIGCAQPTVNDIAYPYEDAGETIVPLGEDAISGTSFLTFEHDGSVLDGDAHLLTRVSRSSYSVLSEVGPSAFLRNKNLSAAYLSGISSIGIAAFAYDTALDNLALLDTVGSIGKYAFYGCSGLTSIVGLNGAADSNGIVRFTIADYAFGGIPGLTYIQVGVPVADNAAITDLSFGKYETVDAQKAVYVYVPLESVVPYTMNGLWNKFTIASQVLIFTMLNVPTGTTIQGISETNSSGVARIESDSRWTVDWDDGTQNTMESADTSFPSHTYLYDNNADSIEKARWETINGVRCRKRIDISITGSIKSLSCQSSSNYPFIATEIGKNNPYLVSISAPETMASLTTLGDFVFQGCTALESVTGFSHVTSIGQYAFNGCTSLSNIGDSDSGFKACTSVGNKAFADCQSLPNLASFASLVSIGIRAFENCISLTGTTGMGSTYSLWTQADWESSGLTATFGAYAFDGCGFGAIDMDNYAVPPNIQNSTFPGDPADVLVFVSSMSGVLESYKAAKVWVRYFENIISASNITIQFGENEIKSPIRDAEGRAISGTAIYGGNGKLAFADAYVLIDWGDGTTTQSVSKYSDVTDGWTFPNHLYTTDVSGSVTVKIRGNISRMYTADGQDIGLPNGESPNPDLKPFLALSTFTTTTVTNPETATSTTVTQISDERKYDYKIQQLSFGNGSRLSRIGTYSFTHCNIGAIKFGKPAKWTEKIKDDMGNDLESIYHDGTMEIADCAFWSCSLTTSINAVEGAISAVGKCSFAGCEKIADVAFLSGAKSIGVAAFKDCIGLQQIMLPATLLSVTESAFEGCYSITSGIVWEQATNAETLANENITIGARAFYGCTGANNEEWSVTIPSQVRSIGESAFENCGMKSFTWGSETDPHSYAIPIGAFRNCANLESFDAYDITAIGAYAFFGCELITGSIFEKVCQHVTGGLGNYAFARCMNLGSITIPSTITALGEGCFSRSAIEFYNGMRWNRSDENASDASNDEVVLPYYSLNDFENAMTASYGNKRLDVWSIFDTIMKNDEIEAGNPLSVSWDSSINGSIGSGCFMNCKGLQIDWENFPSIQNVPSYCFYNCQSLFYGKNLSRLPSTVSYFGRFALARTGLSGIGRFTGEYDSTTGEPISEEPLSASLAPALFLGCFNLTSLGKEIQVQGGTTYADGIVNLFSTVPSEIPAACFYGCSSLSDINMLTMMPSITSLGQYCFTNCSLLSGRGDRSITNALAYIEEIGDGCFMGCTGLDVFDGLPLVQFYPYRAFYGCTGIAAINGFTTAKNIPITLAGDAFGGNENIESIDVSEYSVVIGTSTSSGTNEEGSFSISDPFPDIPEVDWKKNAYINVSLALFNEYNRQGSYWTAFHIITKEVGDEVIKISINVPAEGGTLTIPLNSISIDPGENIYISWGDSAADTISSSSLSTISHTYSKGYSTSIIIYGNVASIKGTIHNSEVDHSTKYKDWLASPFLYSEIQSRIIDGTTYTEGINPWVTSILIEKDITIGEAAFANFSNLSSITLPAQVKQDELKACTFIRCEKLTDIISPNGEYPTFTHAKTVSAACFMESGIRNLDFLSNAPTLTTFDIMSFSLCDNLVNIENIPSSITTFNRGRQFYWCKHLTSLKGLHKTKLTSTGSGTFARVPLESLEYLPTTLVTINNLCFCYTNIENLNGLDNAGAGEGPNHIPASTVTTIGQQAFMFCQSLTDISAYGLCRMAEVRKEMFNGCSALKSLDMGSNSITTIREGCFAYCRALDSSSRLPSSVVTIEKGCFKHCLGLTDLSILASATSITSLPQSCFENCENITSLNGMGDGIVSLGASCFRGCTSLTRLTGISSSITSFGDYCFAGSGLTDLDYIPSALSSLGKHCFEGCTSLEDLSGLDQLVNITEIPEYCFAGCASLKYIVENGASVSNYKSLPENIIRIQNYAFSGCTGLLFIKLGRWQPSSVDSITNLNDTTERPTAFPYSTLAKKSGFHIYVPSSEDDVAKEAYAAVWCVANRFGADFTLDTY